MNQERAGYAIAVKGLEKSYRDWPVLWNLDLTVPWGESLALFGANGAGKTTLLRILSTSARADAGTVRVAGRDLLRQTGEARRRIGVVGHRSFLYEELTPRENLTYYARLYGVSDRGSAGEGRSGAGRPEQPRRPPGSRPFQRNAEAGRHRPRHPAPTRRAAAGRAGGGPRP